VANAAAFFNNVRTPAALLTIPAINSLFLKLQTGDSDTVKHPIVQTVYTLLVTNTVLLEAICVFVSTASSVRLMAGGFNPMGPDAVTFLIREFELPYIAVRISFFMGLLSFMASLALRAWVQFMDHHRRFGNLITTMIGTAVFNMFAYYNSTIKHHNGVLGMVFRFVQLYFLQFQAVAFVSTLLVFACWYMFYVIVQEQMREHGAPTSRLSVGDSSPRFKPKKEN
jgi:hypothetical protein